MLRYKKQLYLNPSKNYLKIIMKVHKEKLMNFDSSIFVDTVYANQSSLNATR